jgi:hypothetical protein
MMKKMLGLAVLPILPILLAGCVSTTLTNLTATSQQRNPKDLYLIEYEWQSNQQTIRPDSVQPFVVVGFDSYEMRQTLKMTNRWEVLVPVPKDKNVVVYRFKVDYEYNKFGGVGKASKNSPEYKLYIK